MTLTQDVGAGLVVLSVIGLCYQGLHAFFGALLSDVEDERIDLAQQASPCRQDLTRYQR